MAVGYLEPFLALFCSVNCFCPIWEGKSKQFFGDNKGNLVLGGQKPPKNPLLSPFHLLLLGSFPWALSFSAPKHSEDWPQTPPFSRKISGSFLEEIWNFQKISRKDSGKILEIPGNSRIFPQKFFQNKFWKIHFSLIYSIKRFFQIFSGKLLEFPDFFFFRIFPESFLEIFWKFQISSSEFPEHFLETGGVLWSIFWSFGCWEGESPGEGAKEKEMERRKKMVFWGFCPFCPPKKTRKNGDIF